MTAGEIGPGDVNDVLDRLPALASKRLKAVVAIGTGANDVYRLRLDDEDYAMRFPGRARYIGVDAEYDNQRRAAAVGVAPAAVGFDRQSGAIVSRWLAGDPGNATSGIDDGALARCLARLHHAAAPFTDTIDPWRALAWNLTPRARNDARIARLASRAAERLGDLPATAWVNCHGDPTAGNVIGDNDDPPTPRLIDWEYSHRGHPAWDLAVACNDRQANTGRADAFLDRYNAAAESYGATPVGRLALEVLRGVTALASAAWVLNHDGDDAGVNRALDLAARWLD